MSAFKFIQTLRLTLMNATAFSTICRAHRAFRIAASLSLRLSGGLFSALWRPLLWALACPLKKRPGSHLGRKRKANKKKKDFSKRSRRKDFKANPTLLCVNSLSLWQDSVSSQAVMGSPSQHVCIPRRRNVSECTDKSLPCCRSYKNITFLSANKP